MRKLLFSTLAGVSLVLNATARQTELPIAKGPYKPADESFQQYKYPAWFRDAKFGIWSHWGPQAVPRKGDWYARNMYIEGHPTYKYHVETYGHPSKFGYKDIIALWKAEKWDPEKLMELFKKAGAKYFVSMGSHHDNYFLWNSKIHKWNSVNIGPQKDVVGLWQKAAKKQGLRFGISEHLAYSFKWFQVSHGADKEGLYAGVPYDGADPRYQDLYHVKSDLAGNNKWLSPDPQWHQEWFACIKEVIDLYKPDLLYSDSPLPFGDVGRSLLAHYYNQDIEKDGRQDVVYTCKEASFGKWAQDVEKGVLDSISPFPWQTDTSIGDWFYKTGQKYRTSDQVAQLLMDIVSKNGNLLINVVQTPEGDLDAEAITVLENLAKWTAANGEGIYATRPWKIYGEGPSTVKENQKRGTYGGITDAGTYTSNDFRFTTKGNNLYAFCMAVPQGDIKITSLGKKSSYADKAIAAVFLLGSKEKLTWKQEDDALVIVKPANMPSWKVSGYKVVFK